MLYRALLFSFNNTTDSGLLKMFKKTNSALLLIVLIALSACNEADVDTSTQISRKTLLKS